MTLVSFPEIFNYDSSASSSTNCIKLLCNPKKGQIVTVSLIDIVFIYLIIVSTFLRSIICHVSCEEVQMQSA